MKAVYATLYNLAKGGDLWAIREYPNRVTGKADSFTAMTNTEVLATKLDEIEEAIHEQHSGANQSPFQNRWR
ncbi:MAG: hypothetical protein U1D30_19615 [Planctomycetota bacterium]